MRALTLKNDQLVISNVDDPIPQKDELLVSVRAIGVNHADLLQRQGKYPPPPGVSPILGLEVAGVVVDPQNTPYKKGDRVMCLLAGGGYAEKVAVHKGSVLPLPENLSFEEGAAIPEVFLTAYQALFLIGELQPEQTVLVHAAGSGVGTAALQLIRAAGASAIATSRTPDKLEKCLALGAKAVINPQGGGFAKKVLEATENHGVELVIDFIGAPYYEENIEALAMGGALIFLATLGGSTLEKFDFRPLLKKWATLSGSTLRSRPLAYKAKLVEEFAHFALPRFASKELKPIIHQVLPWEEADKAHSQLSQSQAFGKLIFSLN